MAAASAGGDSTDFFGAIARLTEQGEPAGGLCGALAGTGAVSGAVISTLGRPLGSQTVCASDDVAARIDEIQIDLGEGPCWEALRTRRPVLETDIQNGGGEEWPGARAALRELPVGALYAFPMFVGDLGVGSVDLYRRSAGRLPHGDVREMTAVAAAAARHVLRRALDDLGNVDDGMADGPYSRREVHQASGMVAAQLSVSLDDAMLVLRGRAFASGRSVREVAADVVARRIVFHV